MEVYSSSVEDQLIDGLSFKLSPGSSYITDRQSVSFFPSGSNIYTTNAGTKILRIVLNGSDWLDPATVRLFFDVKNNDATHQLRVLSGPFCFWRRMRVLVGNQLIEDIDYYARVHQMFDILRARHVRENEDCEGFGARFDQPAYQGILSDSKEAANLPLPNGTTGENFREFFQSVQGGDKKTVSFRPLSGLLNCGKLIPLQYAPITLEFELVSSSTDPIVSNDDAGVAINVSGSGSFVLSGRKNTSLDWQIENPVVKCDICVLDNALNNEYAQLLLSGKALPINYSSYVTQLQTISGQSPSINITRALSRLKSVFVTLDQGLTGEKITNTDSHIQVWKKWWNDFFHPMSYTEGEYESAYEMEFQLQVGSKLFPVYPIRSVTEAFYSLRKCMGVETSNFHSLDIIPYEFRNHKFIAAFDTEKNLGSSFTGINIKQGSLMTLKMKSTAPNLAMPDSCYMVLHFDSILSIRDSGIEVFE